jgi:hypothetical protein
MKGVIFTEFLDFVETRSGYETVDAILEKAAPASGGAYTAVGNYHFSELVALLAALSQITGTPLPELLSAYGRHLFGRFACLYPAFFETIHDPFEFLENIGLVAEWKRAAAAFEGSGGIEVQPQQPGSITPAGRPAAFISDAHRSTAPS